MGNIRHEILALYDGQSNLAALDAFADRPHSLRLVKGAIGGKSIEAGFRAAAGDIVVLLNESEPDPYELIAPMAAQLRGEQCAVVVAGGKSSPLLPGMLAWYLGGMNARDVTTLFRAFDANFLDEQIVESRDRRAVGFELTVKAHQLGLHVEEVRAPQSPGANARSDSLRSCMHWLAQLLQAPVLVWSVWLLMIAVLLSHALAIGKGSAWGHVDNVAILAAGVCPLRLPCGVCVCGPVLPTLSFRWCC